MTVLQKSAALASTWAMVLIVLLTMLRNEWWHVPGKQSAT